MLQDLLPGKGSLGGCMVLVVSGWCLKTETLSVLLECSDWPLPQALNFYIKPLLHIVMLSLCTPIFILHNVLPLISAVPALVLVTVNSIQKVTWVYKTSENQAKNQTKLFPRYRFQTKSSSLCIALESRMSQFRALEHLKVVGCAEGDHQKSKIIEGLSSYEIQIQWGGWERLLAWLLPFHLPSCAWNLMRPCWKSCGLHSSLKPALF